MSTPYSVTMSITPEMLDSFLAEAWECVSALENVPDLQLETNHLGLLCHRLRSSAALYGHPQISSLAGLLERAFAGVSKLGPIERQRFATFCQQSVVCLSDALESIQTQGHEGALGLALSRLGGVELLRELVMVNPAAFREVGFYSKETHKQYPDEPETPSAQNETSETTSGNLAASLVAFHQENNDVWEYFAPEVAEHLETASNRIEHLLDDANPEALQALFRSMHTIKGAAYSVGCNPIGELAHKLEDVLVAVREEGRVWDEQATSILLDGLDALQLMLGVAENQNSNNTQLAPMVDRINTRVAQWKGGNASNTDHNPNTETPTPNTNNESSKRSDGVRVKLSKLETLMALTGEMMASRSRSERFLQRLGDLDDALESSRDRLTRTVGEFSERHLNPNLALKNNTNPALPSNNETALQGRDLSEVFSELEFDRYDDLNILTRRVQELSSDIIEIRSAFGTQLELLRRENEHLEKFVRSQQMELNRVRLLPISRLYKRIATQVRQLSKNPLNLELIGNVELDAVVLEGLAEPLLHMVSNSIIHGLEDSETRLREGKPAVGRFTVRAELRGTQVLLTIEDDGRGVDIERLKAKAIKLGFVTQEQTDALSHEESLDLMFLPGLTVKDEVGRAAGRGVGMDVVRNSVRRLKGELILASEQGIGTTFRMRVPQSMTLSDMVLIEVSGKRYALPRDTVRDLRPARQDNTCARHNLAELLGLPYVEKSSAVLVICEINDTPVGFEVDTLGQLEQALVKPLEMPLANLEHVLGAYANMDGQVTLVLDLPGLLRMGKSQATPQPITIMRPLRVLLVDDSLSVRRTVTNMLEQLGCEVKSAIDGQEALEMCVQHGFDTIITDLEMPRLNGYELIESLRSRPQYQDTPLAMLTTRATQKHSELAYSLGVNAYFTKPINAHELSDFLENVRTLVLT